MSTLSVSNITGLTDLVIDGVDIDDTINAAFIQANTALTTGQAAFTAANNASAWTQLGTHTFSSAETSYAVSSISTEYTKILIIITDLEGTNAGSDSRARMKISGDNGTTTYASGDISGGVRPGDYSSSFFEIILSKYSASNPYIATIYETSYSEDDGSGGGGSQSARTNIGGALNYIEVFDNNSLGFNGGTVTIYGMAV
jgi:hypothetical protein